MARNARTPFQSPSSNREPADDVRRTGPPGARRTRTGADEQRVHNRYDARMLSSRAFSQF
jgi:hypothetical protein